MLLLAKGERGREGEDLLFHAYEFASLHAPTMTRNVESNLDGKSTSHVRHDITRCSMLPWMREVHPSCPNVFLCRPTTLPPIPSMMHNEGSNPNGKSTSRVRHDMTRCLMLPRLRKILPSRQNVFLYPQVYRRPLR